MCWKLIIEFFQYNTVISRAVASIRQGGQMPPPPPQKKNSFRLAIKLSLGVLINNFFINTPFPTLDSYCKGSSATTFKSSLGLPVTARHYQETWKVDNLRKFQDAYIRWFKVTAQFEWCFRLMEHISVIL